MREMTEEEIELADQIENDPLFLYHSIGLSPWSKEQEIIEAIEKYDRVTIRSGNSSGKTYTLGHVVPVYLNTHPHSIIITTAPTWKQVEEILWRYIRKNYNVELFQGRVSNTKIDIAEDWFAIGISTNQPENFQGFHSANEILVIEDEASGVDDPIHEAIDGILASGKSKHIMIGNPTKINGKFAQSFKDPSYHHIQISAFDNPNFTENNILGVEDLTVEKCDRAKIVIPGLAHPKWALEMKMRYGIDSDVFRVRVLGEFPQLENDTLIPLDDVVNAFKREVKQQGALIVGVDVARFGNDWTCMIARQGNKVLKKKKIQKLDLMAVTGEIIDFVREYDDYMINVDSVGIGAGVVDRLNELEYRVTGVNVGESPVEKDRFRNLRAEIYWNLKDEIKNLDLPMINGQEDEDFYQLANIKYKMDSMGRLILESKDDMKKRGLHSPDVADALALTYAYNGDERFNAETDIFFG